MAHNHFTREDRAFLAKLLKKGTKVSECARILDFHPSTIYREVDRGSANTTTGYHAGLSSERAALVRRKANQQHRVIDEHIAKKLLDLIRQYYSPDQAGNAVGVSHSTVYRWLWDLPKETLKDLWKYLRHKKMRRKYGTNRRIRQRELAKKRWIDTRPEEVNLRLEYGHWEGDTVRGCRFSGHLVTLVERKSGFALVGYIKRATKESFRKEAERLFSTLPPELKKSLTLDNGVEMADYEALERRTGITIYFAHPYHSWERGSNENFNGLLRQFFPKKMSFAHLPQEDIDLAAELLNTRPRKRHVYVSPVDLLREENLIAI